jgi:hypothetical protein
MGKMLSANEMLVRGEITAQDVIRLRHEIFADGVRETPEAELLFRMDSECAARDESWNDFFVDALAEFYIFNTEPAGALGDDQTQHLIRHILADGKVAGETELALAIRVIERAQSCPADLGFLVLKAVWDSVMEPAKAAYGKDRRSKVITAEDVEILRKAVHAAASDDNHAVSRAEAELLFALERDTDEAENDITWRDLFVQAVGGHLLAPKAGTTDGIDGDEAQWLLGQIREAGKIRRNERSLLAFLYGKLDNAHPALAPIFAVAGLR